MPIVNLYLKHRDTASLNLEDAECDGYLPYVNGVLGGGDTTLQIDNETGRIIGWTPIKTAGKKFVGSDGKVIDEEEEEEEDEDEDDDDAVVGYITGDEDEDTALQVGTHELFAKTDVKWEKLADCGSLDEALGVVQKLHGEATFSIKYPDGRWHKFNRS